MIGRRERGRPTEDPALAAGSPILNIVGVDYHYPGGVQALEPQVAPQTALHADSQSSSTNPQNAEVRAQNLRVDQMRPPVIMVPFSGASLAGALA